MAQTQANVAGLFKETYREVIPILFEMEDDFCSMIQARADVERAGPRTLRAPVKLYNGGQFRTFSPDGGDLGRGNAAVYEAAVMTPLPVLIALEQNKSVKWNTANDAIAVHNAAKDLLTDGMDEFKTHLDRHLMTAGNGVLATCASNAGLVVTFTSPVGSRLLRPGNRYSVYDTTLATNRGMMTCTSVDYPNKQATFDAFPGGFTVGSDKLLVDNITGATPTWLFGLKYHHNSASTGTWMGLSRVTYPQLRTPEVVATGALVPSYIRLAKSLIELARGSKVWSTGNWQWFLSPAQRQAYEELGLALARYDRKGHENFEAMFNVSQLSIDGMATLVSTNADPSRIDLIDWKNWYRGETLPVGLYTVEDDSTFQIYGASGGLAAAEITYVAQIAQYGVNDPMRAAYISSLTVPTGY
jgi:hypothetical protein